MKQKLNPFNYRGVTLKPGFWEGQRNELIETYLGIPDDDWLHYFRKLAGIEDQGYGLTGWYGNGASTFGQVLGALSHLYLETKDRRIKEKAIALANEWGKCAAASAAVYDVNDTYAYDKLMGGFLDMYESLGYEKGLLYIEKLTESAVRRFLRTIRRDGLQDRSLWENGMIEWYTLPEQLYRAYSLTGDDLYRDFAREWDYPYYFDKLQKKDFRIGPRHAYSHINALSSAARAYAHSGDKKYLEAVINGYDEVTKNHTFATGGYGPGECLFADETGYLGDSLKPNGDPGRISKEYRSFSGNMQSRSDAWGSCEVSCCSWAVFKLTKYLMTLTGNARFGDWAEQLLYNGCGGQPPITSEGQVMYYADYFLDGAMKTVEDRRLQNNGENFEWQCCTGTFPEDVAEYSELLYYYDDEGIYVSQYLPSTVTAQIKGQEITLENTSAFPKEQQVSFNLCVDQPVSCKLRFRIPSWAKGQNELWINGALSAVPVTPDTWLELEREWQNGDELVIKLPFLLSFKAVDQHSPEIKALVYGPLVMAANKMSLFTGDPNQPETWLEPIKKEGYSFAFKTKPGYVSPYPQVTREFCPYYEMKENQWYYMYNRFKEKT